MLNCTTTCSRKCASTSSRQVCQIGAVPHCDTAQTSVVHAHFRWLVGYVVRDAHLQSTRVVRGSNLFTWAGYPCYCAFLKHNNQVLVNVLCNTLCTILIMYYIVYYFRLAVVWLLSGYCLATPCALLHTCAVHCMLVLYCIVLHNLHYCILCTTYLCTLYVIWLLSRCCLSNNLCSQGYHG